MITIKLLSALTFAVVFLYCLLRAPESVHHRSDLNICALVTGILAAVILMDALWL